MPAKHFGPIISCGSLDTPSGRVERLFRETNMVSAIRTIGLAVLASFVAVMATWAPVAAQQQSGQISEARRAAIERCVQQAHQEAIAQVPNSGEQQQRYLIYSNCMVAAGFQP
jgi:hypothetical protein